MKVQLLFLIRLFAICLYAFLRSILHVPYFSVVAFMLVTLELLMLFLKKYTEFEIKYKHELVYTVVLVVFIIGSSIGLGFFV